MAGPDTRERILDAAERLFAARGFAGTSLRAVTQEAGVNLAAVHYHFGSKEALLRAVLTRIVEPVNRERLALLERAEAAAGDGRPAVEEILEAYLAPGYRFIREQGERGVIVTRFLGRSYTEPTELVQALVGEQFGELAGRFTRALERALPDLSPDEVHWRFMCVVGVQTYLLADTSMATMVPADDVDLALRRLITFLAAGLRAPASAADDARGAGDARPSR